MSGGPFDGLGSVLRGLRAERGLTQVALAERANVTKAMLSNYEGGKQRPHLDTLARLLTALGVRLGEVATRLERHGDPDGEEDDHREIDRLQWLLDEVQGAAEDAGEGELATGLSHLRVLHCVGWAGHAVAALGRLMDEVRSALRARPAESEGEEGRS